MIANTGGTDIGPLFPGVCLYFVCYAKTAGAGLWAGLSAGPHHLKFNNIPKSGILRKCITGKLKPHMLIKNDCRGIALEDI